MKKLVLLAAVVGIAYGGWKWKTSSPAVSDRAGIKVTDRFWIDRLPRDERDKINIFATISRQPVGIYEVRSMWTGAFEAFRYELSGNELRVLFPQTNTREKLTVNARRCNEKGMDFCLDVSGGSHGVQHYYSREGWEIRDLGDVEAAERALPTEATP
jgi:hypothetical protein